LVRQAQWLRHRQAAWNRLMTRDDAKKRKWFEHRALIDFVLHHGEEFGQFR
jgi:hypothetical protein